MTFSPLATHTLPHHGKYNPRNGQAIQRVIVHHWAGTSGGDIRLTSPGEEVSANYVLYSNGSLAGQVPEEYRAWTSGSWNVDAPSITVETQNSGLGGEWPVSDAALEKLVQLVTDIARRYEWGRVTRDRVCGHRQFAATACPGNYLWSRLAWIADEANRRLHAAQTIPSPALNGGDVEALARAVIRGDYGNGNERRNRLGALYDQVQARVNQILQGNTPAAAPAPAPAAAPAADIDALADAVIRGDYGNGNERRNRLGALYDKVQARVNQKLGLAHAPTPAPDIDALADAVIRGDYGNGQDRRNRLGSLYDAVQARVNQKLGY